jgi:hypothetical protein
MQVTVLRGHDDTIACIGYGGDNPILGSKRPALLTGGGIERIEVLI